MKLLKRFSMTTALFLTLLQVSVASSAVFVSGSTGSDGDFAPAANTVLQIPDSGVFNFGTVNIPSGVTVTFKKNAQNTGVTILAVGDVTINGAIDLSGSSGNYIIAGVAGPGGFDGGVGGVVNGNGRRGQGPGGGVGGTARTNSDYAGGCGGGGAFSGAGGGGATIDTSAPGGGGGTAYGNERILPAIGGSGGAGGGGTNSYVGGAGGGGGGAIVIASSGTITVNGSITANGGGGANGESQYCGWWGCSWTFRGGAGGGGAGGSIRFVANTIRGNGGITANGGGGGRGWDNNGGSGSAGRIRMEAQSNLRTTGTSPPMSVGYPYAVIPPSMPSLSVTSIGGINVPAIPKGAFGSPDVTLPFNTKNPITIVVSGTNIPVGTTVTLNAVPEMGNISSASGALSGTDASSSVSIPINIVTAYPSLITATVTFQLTAANGGPFYVNGERVDKVRVAANLGGTSSVFYITESGREFPAVM